MAHHPLTRRLFLALALLIPAILLGACSNKPQVVNGEAVVTLDGREFTLKIAADEASRARGLGGVEHLAPDEGMLFVFPNARLRSFVMRDCLIDIDIIFLDAAGRIVAMHHMPAEEPKKPDETQYDYEMRLAKYASRFNSKYVIEIQGGMLEQLNLKTGDLVELDTQALDALAT